MERTEIPQNYYKFSIKNHLFTTGTDIEDRYAVVFNISPEFINKLRYLQEQGLPIYVRERKDEIGGQYRQLSRHYYELKITQKIMNSKSERDYDSPNKFYYEYKVLPQGWRRNTPFIDNFTDPYLGFTQFYQKYEFYLPNDFDSNLPWYEMIKHSVGEPEGLLRRSELVDNERGKRAVYSHIIRGIQAPPDVPVLQSNRRSQGGTRKTIKKKNRRSRRRII